MLERRRNKFRPTENHFQPAQPVHYHQSPGPGRTSYPERLAENLSPFRILPLIAGEAALRRLHVQLESILRPPQIQHSHGQFFVGLADPEDVAALVKGTEANIFGHAVDGVRFGVKISGHFAGDHSDLAFVGPGHELIRISQNKKSISMNSAGHRVARIGVQYAPGVDLRPAVCSKECYG